MRHPSEYGQVVLTLLVLAGMMQYNKVSVLVLDIQAVLSGLSGCEALRGLLVRLQPKGGLLLGWSVPVPLPVRSRRYGDVFWK